ncbi:MAG: hypothetical protein JOZ41_10400 [Chloroflexi bacterium]|nr:hypothetical protein [Chloroflexota bacterium]
MMNEVTGHGADGKETLVSGQGAHRTAGCAAGREQTPIGADYLSTRRWRARDERGRTDPKTGSSQRLAFDDAGLWRLRRL